MNGADAAELVAGWQRRLIALAETPEHLVRETPRHLIEEHHGRRTTFAGYTEAEVAEAEARLGMRFPAVFRAYLRAMAKSPGDLFRGSELAGVADFERFRADALAMLADADPSLTLPPEAVVFLAHQGSAFVYLPAAGGFDVPPMVWTEAERAPRLAAAGFADMVDAELRLMERHHAAALEQGGSYLTLHPEGGSTRSYPPLGSGERPLGRVQGRRPWWRFWQGAACAGACRPTVGPTTGLGSVGS